MQLQRLVTQKLLESRLFHQFARSSHESVGRYSDAAKDRLDSLSKSTAERGQGLGVLVRLFMEEFREATKGKRR